MGLRDFTLADAIDTNALQHGERCAFIVDGRWMSHAEYKRDADRLAAGLAAAGVARGDRVAVLARNGAEYVLLFGACARLGAMLVPVNTRLGADEIGHILADSCPRVVIAGPEFREAVEAHRDHLPSPCAYFPIGSGGGIFQGFEALTSAGETPAAAETSADDGFVLLYTAAIDGRARGAVLTQASVLAGNLALRDAWALGPADVNLGLLPLFHLAGMNLMFSTLLAGGASVIEPSFDAARAVQLASEHRVTVLAVFSPMLETLLNEAGDDGAQLASLRVVTGLESAQNIARLESLCPKADFWTGYGQSETSGFVTLSRYRECPGSAGRPNQQYRVRLVDDFDRDVDAGVAGEIVVRGPAVFRGYWRRPEDDAFTFRNDWHHTGDLGRFDAHGYLWYMGRSPARDLIKSGGENVYPAEVEKVLLQHPAISEAVVIGVSDARWGEAVKAVCVRAPAGQVEADELIAFVAARLARFKRPKEVVFVPALPRTAAGLPDRARLKQEHGAGTSRPQAAD